MDLRLKHNDAVTWDNPSFIPKTGVEIDSGIRYSILAGPAYNTDGNAITATYLYRISVNDMTIWQHRVRGFATRGLGGFLDRRMPLADPDDLGMVCIASNAVAYESMSGIIPATSDRSPFFKEITGRPIGPGKLGAVYNYVRMEVTFAIPMYAVIDNGSALLLSEKNRYCTSLETYTAEYVQLDRGVIKWADGPSINEQVATGAGLIRAVGELVVTWHRVPADAVAVLRPIWQELLSTVNVANFNLPLFGVSADEVTFPAETLLFRPWQMRPTFDGAGNAEYDVELHWGVRQNVEGPGPNVAGWNHFLHPVDGQYYRCVWDDPLGDRDIYAREDHELIFQPS